MQSTFLATLLLGLSTLHPHPPPARMTPAVENKVIGNVQDSAKTPYTKHMKMSEPMPTGMAKPGMKKGDVKKAAEKEGKKMEKIMNEEMK